MFSPCIASPSCYAAQDFRAKLQDMGARAQARHVSDILLAWRECTQDSSCLKVIKSHGPWDGAYMRTRQPACEHSLTLLTWQLAARPCRSALPGHTDCLHRHTSEVAHQSCLNAPTGSTIYAAIAWQMANTYSFLSALLAAQLTMYVQGAMAGWASAAAAQRSQRMQLEQELPARAAERLLLAGFKAWKTQAEEAAEGAAELDARCNRLLRWAASV